MPQVCDLSQAPKQLSFRTIDGTDVRGWANHARRRGHAGPPGQPPDRPHTRRRRRRPGGAPSVPVDACASRVAMSPAGGLALMGWLDHYHGVVQIARLAGGRWGAATTIGKGTAWAAFQEVMGLGAGSDTVAAAIWKNAKTGTQTMTSTLSG